MPFTYGQSSFNAVGGATTSNLSYIQSTYMGASGLYGNVAGIETIEHYGINVGYTSRYSLDELSLVSIAGIYRTRFGTIGLTTSRFGFEDFNESKVGVAYARKIMKTVRIGAMFDMLAYNSRGREQERQFTIEAGLQSDVSDKLTIGVAIFNPINSKIDEFNTIPTKMSLGVLYKVASSTNLRAEFSKVTDRDIDVRAAVEYNVMDNLAIYMGGTVTTTALHFGLSYRFSGIDLQGGFATDNRLGNTPSISIGYEH